MTVSRPERPSMHTAKKPAIFIDRDGVVIELIDYLNCIEQVKLVPGVADAIREVNRSGVPLVMITNQSAIARGLLTEAGLQDIHARLRGLLAEHSARIDAIYFCPHHPSLGNAPYRRPCACRKPEPGMLLQAARDLDLDLSRSAIIGDHASDIEAGRRAGVARTLLVLTGHGEAARQALESAGLRPSDICPDAPSALRTALAGRALRAAGPRGP